jgi:hypothetical protein
MQTIPKQFGRWNQSFWSKVRREILLDLANLNDDSCAYFRRRFPTLDVSRRKDDQEIIHFRNQLRRLWRKEKEEDRFAPLHEWVRYSCLNRQQTWVVATYDDGTYRVEPQHTILALTLALGASEYQTTMALCENPGCPQKYFLRGRKTQQFCLRPACTVYGQRQHKLEWWREKGEKWRREKRNRRKCRGRKTTR